MRHDGDEREPELDSLYVCVRSGGTVLDRDRVGDLELFALAGLPSPDCGV
jgi:hypothetical protein